MFNNKLRQVFSLKEAQDQVDVFAICSYGFGKLRHKIGYIRA